MAGLADAFNVDYNAAKGAKTKLGSALLERTGLNWPKGRDVLDLATNIPVVGDALSGGMAVYDAAKGDYGSAAMNALGVLPFVTAGTVKGVGKAADAISGKKLTEFEQRHLIAQHNAALPVNQGGLGLPADNTAMDRAMALGFDTHAYHGTNKEFSEFDPSKTKFGLNGVFTSTDPKGASKYVEAGNTGLPTKEDGGFVMPLMVNGSRSVEPEYFNITNIKNELSKGNNVVGGDVVVIPDASRIRSRFAAFDPMRRNESDLLGNINPQLLGAMGIGSVGAAAATSQLPDEYKSAIANAFSGR